MDPPNMPPLPSDRDAALRVTSFCKVYDDFLAVDDLSFALRPGSVCGLVGPNGAGKTTTLRAIAGLIHASSGRLQVDGFDVRRDALAVRHRLAYVPDDPPLFDDLTVWQHLELIGRLYDLGDYQHDARNLLEQFELLDKMETAASGLSRGMRQKLAICCSHLFRPSVLLLDEPMTGLDPPGIRTLLASVRQRSNDGTTIVISSHLLAMIEDVCSDVLVMQSGRCRYFGPRDGLIDAFADGTTTPTLEAAYFAATETDGTQRETVESR
ncbi:MAG: ABC transporter ATP-binding protein [Planctomycetota bacterium]